MATKDGLLIRGFVQNGFDGDEVAAIGAHAAKASLWVAALDGMASETALTMLLSGRSRSFAVRGLPDETVAVIILNGPSNLGYVEALLNRVAGLK